MPVLGLHRSEGFFSSCGEGGLLSLRWAGFSLQSVGPRCVGFGSCGSWAPGSRLSSCGAWAELLLHLWSVPGPGIEPMSPALAGGLFTTAPPGEPQV